MVGSALGHRLGFASPRERASLGTPKLALAIALALVLATGALFAPTTAFADYSNPSVSTIAQVRTNGSLHVVEQRLFSFDTSYSMIAWPISRSNSNQEIDVQSVHMIKIDENGNALRDENPFTEVPFQLSWRTLLERTDGSTKEISALRSDLAKSDDASESYIAPFKPSTYALDERRSMIYLFLESISDDATIECDYSISNAVTLYDDISELYWDYACEWPDTDTEELMAQIQLPVPDGMSVEPGKNVLAWGHGPDGTLEIGIDGTVKFAISQLKAGSSAYAHVLFPKTWISNAGGSKKMIVGGTRFDSALAEEESWIDTTAGWWLNRYSIEILLLGISLALLVISLVLFLAFGRKRPPLQDAGDVDIDKFDSSVIARLMRWNHWSIDDFPESVRGVAEAGAISIHEDDDQVDMTRFIVLPKARSVELSDVERLTMRILFDDFGQEYESMSLAEFGHRCKADPANAKQWMDRWQKALSREVENAGLFDRRSFLASRWTWGIALLALVLAAIEAFGVGGLWFGILMLLVALAIATLAYMMPRMTPLGAYVFEACVGSESEIKPWQARMSQLVSSALLPKAAKNPRGNGHKQNAGQ